MNNNSALKAAFISPHLTFKAAFFHSTPLLDRKRRTHWDSGGGSFGDSSKRFNNYAKRVRKAEAKRTLLRNVGAYAERLFQSWKCGDDQDDQPLSGDTSWFKRQYWAKGTRRDTSDSQDSYWENYRNRRKGGFKFCFSDGEEVEYVIRSAFGGERCFYWSSSSAEDFQWRYTSGYSNHRSSWNGGYKREEYDTYTDYNSSESDLISDRLALGLSSSGPLKLEEVKTAYRACALRWHPDRHQGPSKVAAEEKFKQCSAAYKSLCDNLAVG